MAATLDDVRKQLSLARSASVDVAPSDLDRMPIEAYDPAGAVRILQVQILHLGNAIGLLLDALERR